MCRSGEPGTGVAHVSMGLDRNRRQLGGAVRVCVGHEVKRFPTLPSAIRESIGRVEAGPISTAGATTRSRNWGLSSRARVVR